MKEGWKSVKLGEIADVKMGQSPQGSSFNNLGKGFPFLQGNRTFGHKFPTVDTWTTSVTKVANKGDVLMSVRAPVGDLNIAASDFCIGRGVCAIKAKNNEQEFLYYLMKFIVPVLRQNSNGTTFASVNRSDIENVNIDLPPLSVQKRIAAVLGALDDKIELNRKMNKNLEEQAQALYKSWFIDFEPFGGKMPKEWKRVPLDEYVNFQEGPGIRNWQYVNEDGIKFINIRCITDGDINTSNANMISKEEAFGKYAHFMLRENDIVMSCSGTLGRYAIVRADHLPLCLNTSVIRFWPKIISEQLPWLYGYLSSNEFLKQQKSFANGSAQVNFGPTHLKRMYVVAPNNDAIIKYHTIARPIIRKMLTCKYESRKLAEMRDALLPKLMSGEVEV